MGAWGSPTVNAVAMPGAEGIGKREIWRELLLFALVMLMLEWWAWNRRKVA